MLVVAPLRVARETWPAEVAKWSEFAGLRVALLHGPKKDDILRSSSADVYLINYEGLPWLCNNYFGRPLPFDVIVFDELTRLKNAQSGRSKALRPHLKGGPRWRWGLTGSLAGDGDYLDVFGQQLVLDDGAALGKFVTWYRNAHFTQGFDGFTYTLNRGHEQQVLAKLAPYWFRMEEADYAELPEIVDHPIEIALSAGKRLAYTTMRDAYVAKFGDRTITAANAGAAYAKLAQMANGAVYDDAREVHHIHDDKIEALDDLVEELNGLPLLLGYEFNHDLVRLQKWHIDRFKKELPYLGKGTKPAQEAAWIAAWSRNELPVLAGHPASMGHGLNLQEGGCTNICWFSLPWSYELYDQFVRRVRRGGNVAPRVFNHMLVVKGTVDEEKLASRDVKGFTTENLVAILNREISREERETGRRPGSAGKENEMVARLTRPADNSAAASTQVPGWGAQPIQNQPVAAAPAVQQATSGWGATQTSPTGPQTAPQSPPMGWGAPAAAPDTAQREAIRAQIAPDAKPAVGAGFSGAAASAAAAIASTNYDEVPAAQPAGTAKRTRRTKAEMEADAKSADENSPAPRVDNTMAVVAALSARMECLKLAFADATTPLGEGLAVADDLWAWVNKM